MNAQLQLLILEDSADAALRLGDELQRHGFDFHSHRVEDELSFRQALVAGKWDLILADYHLPSFSAPAALAIVQELQLDIPFIVVSGSVSEEIVVDVMRAGAHDYIMKTALTRLAPAVRRELGEARLRAERRETAQAATAALETAESALKRSEARLLRAQRMAQIGSWEVDLLTNTLTWSPETYRIFGCDPATFRPTVETFYELIHPLDRSAVVAASKKSLAETGVYAIEHRIVRPDGSERTVHEQAELVRDAEGRPVQKAGTVQDITDRKRLEERLRRSQKLEAIGQLAGGIAHDFNNILTVILGYADLVASSPYLDLETSHQVRQIVVGAERAAKLTQQLLAFSRKQPINLKHVNLNETLRLLRGKLQSLTHDATQLDLTLDPELPNLQADPELIEQAVINLILNARDALPSGGHINVETSRQQIGAEYCQKHPEASPGPHLCLQISDSGTGMDAHTRSHLFEPFFTTKEVGKGTGLGLSTTYGIVRQHQGWIDIESELGRGTTVRVFLPTRLHAASPPTRALRGAAKASETVLIVEDEPALRELARSILQRCGYRVLQAASSAEALSIWQAQPLDIHLILTDVMLPDGISGIELAHKLKSEAPRLRFLFSSGYTLESLPQHLSLQPGSAFISKPYTAATLVQAVRSCLDQVSSCEAA